MTDVALHDDEWEHPKPHKCQQCTTEMMSFLHGRTGNVPNKGMAWTNGWGGNPTRHCSVTTATNVVEEKETKGLGVEPSDKRKHNEPEFLKVLKLFREETDFNCKVKHPMMSLWVCHFICWIDDTAHFLADDPHGNAECPFACSINPREMGQKCEEAQALS